MTRLAKIYLAYLRTSLAVQLQYRAALLIWLLHLTVEPVIYLVVWSTVARAQGGGVGDFTPGDFAGYYLVMMLVNHATFTWIMWESDVRVRDGSYSAALLRPVHPIHSDVADNLAYKICTITVMLPTAAILALAFRPEIHPQPWAIAAFIPALVLAYFVRFIIEWALSLAAFWTTRIVSINEMYYVALVFFGGRFAPLELLPRPVHAVAAGLPFRWMLSFPVELLLGRLSATQAAQGLAMQALWLGVGVALVAGGWRAAVRRYSAVGS